MEQKKPLTEIQLTEESFTGMNAKNILKQDSSKNKPLLEKYPVEDTPFWLIKDSEKNKWHIFWGKYMLSEGMSKNRCENMIKTKHWQLITILVTSIFMEMKKLDEENEKMQQKLKNRDQVSKS